MNQGILISDRLNRLLFKKTRVAVLTGSGISAESGVPTFRGEDGLWKKFRPEELATFDAFMANPQLVWEWYEYRRKIIQEIRPNPGHIALVDFQKHFEKFDLITQNVDGLHHAAGSKNVTELHGNIRRNKCVRCGEKYEILEGTVEGTPPKCPCGGNIRPDVVWFGEMLPQDAINYAFTVSSKCDLFFSVGTSAVVHPAASLPLVAKRGGAYVVEVNISPTEISHLVDESLLGKSGEILPSLVKLLK
ncbi:MAG: NAD-dependent protein deacylase [candidate division Zixibacteria bacterium]|nr:NAD-dependent protein deacylase [candidate division Zixibacteria bacterium]